MPRKLPPGHNRCAFLIRQIAQSSLLKIAQCLEVADRVVADRSGCLLEHGDRVMLRALCFEVSEAFAKGQMTGQRTKEGDRRPVPTVTVNRSCGRNIDEGPGFLDQGTESDELGALAAVGRPNLLAAGNRAAKDAVVSFSRSSPTAQFSSGGDT